MGLRANGVLTFDHQVIIDYLNGAGDDAIQRNTTRLINRTNTKNIETKLVTLRAGNRNKNANRGQLLDAANWITGPFRLYLHGHGDWEMKTLGGRGANEVAADFVTVASGKYEHCKLISIVGCEMAKSEHLASTGVSMASFGSEFHRRISSDGTFDDTKGIPVFARTEPVSMITAEAAAAHVDFRAVQSAMGQPVDKPLLEGMKTGGKSKKLFYWHGGKQMMVDAAMAAAILGSGVTGFGDEIK
jgi:hypothetical protein